MSMAVARVQDNSSTKTTWQSYVPKAAACVALACTAGWALQRIWSGQGQNGPVDPNMSLALVPANTDSSLVQKMGEIFSLQLFGAAASLVTGSILPLAAASLPAAMAGAVPAQAQGQPTLGSFERDPLMGGGYYSVTGAPLGRNCLVNFNATNNTRYGNRRGKLDLSNAVGLDQMSRLSNVKISASGGWGWFSFSSTADWLKMSQNDRYRETFYYADSHYRNIEYIQPPYARNNGALNEAAQAALSASPEAFLHYCGDKFISGAQAGAMLVASVSVNFDTAAQKNAFAASASVNLGMGQITAAISQAMSQSEMSGTLSISVSQAGGNPRLLPNIFKKNPQGEYYIFACNFTDLPACDAALGALLDYGKSFANQTESPYVFSISTTRYSDLGVTIPDYPLTPTVLEQQRNLTRWIKRDMRDLEFVKRMRESLYQYMPSDATNALRQATRHLQSRLGSYQNNGVLDSCFATRANDTCQSAYDAVAYDREVSYPVNQTMVDFYKEGAFLAEFTETHPGSCFVTFVPLDHNAQLYRAECNSNYVNCATWPCSVTYDGKTMNFKFQYDYAPTPPDHEIMVGSGLVFDGAQYVGVACGHNTIIPQIICDNVTVMPYENPY